jgi:hypothetical protein
MGQALEDMDAVPLADKALTISAAQPEAGFFETYLPMCAQRAA